MTVENTDQKEFDFTALLHTYLNVDIQSMTGTLKNIPKSSDMRAGKRRRCGFKTTKNKRLLDFLTLTST